MSDRSSRKSVLRLFGCTGALLLAADMLAFKLLGENGTGSFSEYMVVVVDSRVLDWLSFMAWPAFVLIGVSMGVVPQLKEVQDKAGTRGRLCFWLLVVGYLVDAAGRTVLTGPVIGNGLAVFGSAMQLGGAVVYLWATWQDIWRSLHPSVRDILLQAGTLWLLGGVAVHFTHNVAAAMEYGSLVYLRSSDAVYQGFALGFVANTGLWLLSTIMPRFLGIPQPRQRAVSSIVAYNVLLVLWVFGESWCLAYPYTWVRLPLTLTGLGLAGVTAYMLRDMSALNYLGARVKDGRRVLAKVASFAAMVSMLGAVTIIAGIGVWLGSTNDVSLPLLHYAVKEVLRTGLGSYLLIALLVGFLGQQATAGVKRVLVWSSIGAIGLAVAAEVGVTLVVPMTMLLDLGALRSAACWANGAGHLLLALWLFVSTYRA